MDSSIRSLSRLAIANEDQRIWNRWNRSWGRSWLRLWNQQFYSCHVSTVVTCKIKCCQIVFIIIEYPHTSWLTPHDHMPPPNLPTLGTKIKRFIAQWIAFLIVEDGGHSLMFAKVTKSSSITHPLNWSDRTSDYEPKIGIWLRKLTNLAPYTLIVKPTLGILSKFVALSNFIVPSCADPTH